MPDAVQLLAYQQQGVAYLARQPYALLGDDTGLGKSAQCIVAADALKYRRILILCPLIGAVSWRIELGKWQRLERAYHQFNKRDTRIGDGPLAYVLPYSVLSVEGLRIHAMTMVRRAEPFDVVIVDEAQFLSNFSSKRTTAVYGKWCSYDGGVLDFARPKSVWLLSGTIQRRDVRDLYPHLKALLPEVINTAMGRPLNAFVKKRDFEQMFLISEDGFFGTSIVGNNNQTIPALRAALKPFVLARRKRDVAPELGSIRQYDLPLGIDPDDPYAPAAYHPEFGKRLIEELWSHTNLHSAMALSETAAEERRILGMIKVRPAATWAEDFLNAGEATDKLVIFAWHRDVIRELADRLSEFNPRVIMGGTPDEDRRQAVHDFQNELDCRLIVGQTVAMSTSITLTAASTVMTLEPDWLPHNDYQAVSRVHRLGQTEPVFNYRCFADGTIDSRIIQRANARLRDFEFLMDGIVERPTGKRASP